jgi:hypothetical protein
MHPRIWAMNAIWDREQDSDLFKMILLAWALTVWSRLLVTADADERTAETCRIQCRRIIFSFFRNKRSLIHLHFYARRFWLSRPGWSSKNLWEAFGASGLALLHRQVGRIVSPLISKSRWVPRRPDRRACCCDFIRLKKSQDMVNIDCEWIISFLTFFHPLQDSE